MSAAISRSALPLDSAAPDVDVAAIFARVTEQFLAINAQPVRQYLCDPPFDQNVASSSAVTLQTLNYPNTLEPDRLIPKAVAQLHQACQTTFGNTLALKFDFEDDETTHGKRCTLTITRPNGVTRTYTSPTVPGRKYDAKASACSIAIQNGAIQFITASDPRDATMRPDGTEDPNTPLEMDESVKAIEQCCLEWGSGRINPFWLNINEPKFGRTQGCALRIRLGPRNSRVWSVKTIYNTPAEAKKACAEAALAEGIIDYIKSWSPFNDSMTEDTKLPAPISLQAFFESLPQPFHEPIAGKSAIDINGPAWLNTSIQSARGGKMVPNFVWTVDPRHGFHGCLLRLERPSEVRSYLVDARFLKRMEAKAAVCLLAMSEGVGDYIRGVGKAVEDKLTPSMRKHVSDVLLPIILAEYRKVRGPGIQPTFEYDQDLDACGATMLVELTPKPTTQQVQRYSVPAEYRSRNDAKLAVVLHAAEQGAIEFLRFVGNSPPLGYVPDYAPQEHQFVNRKRKWENRGGSNGSDWSGPSDYAPGSSWQNGGWQNKRPRGAGGFPGNFSVPVSHAQGGSPSHGHRGQYMPGGGYQNDSKLGWQKKQQNATWKGNRAPGPGHIGGGGGQYKPGFKSVGGDPRIPQHHRQPIFSSPSPYLSVPMQPQPQPPIPSPSSPYLVGGTVPGVQPSPVGYYGTAPPAQQIHPPYQTHAIPSPGPQAHPYGVPTQPAPGSNLYPYAQSHAAAVGAPIQYSSQYPYGFTPAPGQIQASVYPTYPAAQQPYYPSVPPVSTPVAPQQPGSIHAPVPVATMPPAPYVGPMGVTPANPTPPVPYIGPPLATQGPQTPRLSVPIAIPSPVVPPPPPANPAPPLPPFVGDSADKAPQPKPNPLTPSSSGFGDGRKVTKPSIPIEPAPKTSVSALYDYCEKQNMDKPQWGHEIVRGQPSDREPKHKVWVVIGKMKFELPVTFTSLNQGQEKIAKKVVEQLQGGKTRSGHGSGGTK